MAVVLLAPDARRLIEVVLPVQHPRGTPSVPPAPRSRVTQATAIVKWVVVMSLIAVHVRNGYEGRASALPNPALYGIYDVEDFVRGGVALPPGDSTRWQRFVVAEYDTAGIQTTAGRLELHYSAEGDGRLIVEGIVHGEAVRARLKATDVTHFTLRQPLR